MTNKERAAKKAELCDLHSEAINNIKEFFKNKKEELKLRNGKSKNSKDK